MSPKRRGAVLHVVRQLQPPSAPASFPSRYRTKTGVIYPSQATGLHTSLSAGVEVSDLTDEQIERLLALDAIEKIES